MQIKRFEARSMTLALQMVKAEFGPDAVILSARSLRSPRGIFGPLRPAGVEVTAAQDSAGGIDRGRLQPPPPPAPAVVREPEGAGRGLFRSLNHSLKQFAIRRRPEEDLPPRGGAGPSPLPDRHQLLLAQEVERELAAEIIAHVERHPESDPREELMRRLESQGLRRRPEAEPPRALVLVGSSGVGKTTTAIKLAAELIGRGRLAALLSLDDRRIGALAQLRIYADILGIPLTFAGSGAEAAGAAERVGAGGTLIVDTPGVSPGEEDRRTEIDRILAALPGAERYLTLALNSRERDLARIAVGWQGAALSGLVFTRLDETDVWGPALNLSVQTRLPVAWVSCGPRIPEDLCADPLAVLLERLVRLPEAARKPAARPPAGVGLDTGRLVANRNSDLYHRPECRWVHKIKPENLIRFAAPAEAEARHFLPCRNCSPDQPAAGAFPPAAAGADRCRAGMR